MKRMNRAALGFAMHSGWGVVVAVSGGAEALEILDRRRIVVIDPKIPGMTQPYHFAATLGLADAEKHIAKCAKSSAAMARAVVEALRRELDARGYRIVASAVILASGRVLPPLEKVLGAHPLLHSAEGQFFRDVAGTACAGLNIPVTGIPERELEERAKTAFGNSARGVRNRISNAGKEIGSPWTKDHKNAALAAAIALGS